MEETLVPRSLPVFTLCLLFLNGHMIAIEFLGTFLFSFLAFSGIQGVKTKPRDQTSTSTSTSTGDQLSLVLRLYSSFVFGVSLTANLWAFYSFTGRQFNPAVTLGLVVAGTVELLTAVLIMIVQGVGGIVAAALVDFLLPGKLDVGVSKALNISTIQGLLIETILTFILMTTILMVRDVPVHFHRCTMLTPLPEHCPKGLSPL